MDLEIKKIEITQENAGENAALLDRLLSLSREWAEEKTCPSYNANDESEYYGKEIYAAFDCDRMIAYLMGHIIERLEERTSYNAIGEKAFELDELYVPPQYRSIGIGKKLFRFAEDDVREMVDVIALTAVSFEYNKLLRFYIDELGMSFNHALLVKRTERVGEESK